jgi:hypothetical protein
MNAEAIQKGLIMNELSCSGLQPGDKKTLSPQPGALAPN